MYTFLEHFDWSGKRIHPFCTHEGSGMSGTEGKIAQTCPGATVCKGLAIHGEYSFDDPPLSVGETVQVLIYRLYVLDGDKTYLKENSAMTSADVFYI